MRKIDLDKWEILIEKHYISICNRKKPPFTYTYEEMKFWWLSLIDKRGELIIESFIKGITEANIKGYFYHPV